MIERQNGTDEEVVICLTTFPDSEKAGQIGTVWVDSQLAACVQILPGVQSIYRWEGKTETAHEALVIAKTTASRLAALEASLRAHHPYELPELVVLTPAWGSEDYLAWVRRETTLDKSAS